MTTKHAAALRPGDHVDMHGRQQTVTRVEQWVGPTIAVFTDYTGDDPWLAFPADRIFIHPASEGTEQ